MHRQEPDICRLHMFGCKTFVYFPKQYLGGRFTLRTEVGIFMGIDRGDAFQVFMDKPKKMIVSNDATFDKSNPNTDVTRVKNDKFISFGLPGLEAKYFLDDSSTAAVQNTKQSLDDPQEGEEDPDH